MTLRMKARLTRLMSSEWFFLVVSTKRIAEAYGDQKYVRLSRVQEIEEAVSYWELRERVDLELPKGT